MKVSIEGTDRTSREYIAGTIEIKAESVEMTMWNEGIEAYVRMELGGRLYEFDYREFQQAARAVCGLSG